VDTKYEDSNTSDLVLGCGGRVVNSTKSFVYLDSLLQRQSLLRDTVAKHHDSQHSR
jgi:hypothetical protein